MGTVFLDKWSLTHVAWGFAAGKVKMDPWVFLGLHTTYEVWENSESGSVIKIILKHEKDTLLNVLGDTLSAMAGWWLGDYSN